MSRKHAPSIEGIMLNDVAVVVISEGTTAIELIFRIAVDFE